MAHFPGRTLEELDAIDLPRHMRAWEAQRIYEGAKTVVDFFSQKIGESALQGIDRDLREEVKQMIIEAKKKKKAIPAAKKRGRKRR